MAGAEELSTHRGLHIHSRDGVQCSLRIGFCRRQCFTCQGYRADLESSSGSPGTGSWDGSHTLFHTHIPRRMQTRFSSLNDAADA